MTEANMLTTENEAKKVNKVNFDNLPWFSIFMSVMALTIVFGLLYLYLSALWEGGKLSIDVFGVNFLFGTEWDPVNGNFGALPFIIGTILTSLLAIVLAVPLGVMLSLYIVEYAPRTLKNYLRTVADLLAAIPSVIYGLWGIFILGPFIVDLGDLLIGFILPKTMHVRGNSIFTASVILMIMILPILINILIDAFETVPDLLKDGMYALGSTKWEVSSKVIIKSTYPTIVAATLLALARALGETMAVTMVIGNAYGIPTNIFDAGHTITSIIANEFTEAASQLHLAALFELALILFMITFLFNVLGLLIVKRIKKKFGATNR